MVGLEEGRGTESRGGIRDVVWSFVHNCLLLKPHLPPFLPHDLLHRTLVSLLSFLSQEREVLNPMMLTLDPSNFITAGVLEKW